MEEPDLERNAGGEDSAETINPQTLLIIAATILMFAVLIFGWVFAGKILEKLDEGVDKIGAQIIKAVDSVEAVGEIVVQEVLKGTGTVINQISGIVTAFDDAIGPLLKLVVKTSEDLIDQMGTAIAEIVGVLNVLGQGINEALQLMITQLGIVITSSINDTLGFIQTIFAPFFQ